MNAEVILRKQIVDVVALQIAAARWPLRQMIGVLTMGVTMIEEAEGVVESLAIGHAGRAWGSESPFADYRRAVAGVAQYLRDRDVFRPQRMSPFPRTHA